MDDLIVSSSNPSEANAHPNSVVVDPFLPLNIEVRALPPEVCHVFLQKTTSLM